MSYKGKQERQRSKHIKDRKRDLWVITSAANYSKDKNMFRKNVNKFRIGKEDTVSRGKWRERVMEF